MSKRLSKIASYIKNGTGFIDVGTDHGFLPVELIKKGYTGAVFASDINEAPLASAARTAEAAGVSDKISFLLCDGLDRCPPEAVDTIVIAGMGGDTICGILDRAEWCMDERYTLILQPMTKIEIIRYWLVYNGFEIQEEALVKENGALYQLFTARFGGITRLSDAELFTGALPLIKNDPNFNELHTQLCLRFKKAYEGILRAPTAGLEGKLELIGGILKQLKEMS